MAGTFGGTWGRYSYTGDLYGAIFGDKNLAWVTIETVNGVRIGHSSTVVAQVDISGNAMFAAGAFQVDMNGAVITMPASYSLSHGFRFASGFTGTNFCGVFADENAPTRQLILYNSTSQATRRVESWLYAGGASTAAYIEAVNDEQGGGAGPQIIINTHLVPIASNAVDLGISGQTVRNVAMTGTLTFNAGGTCFAFNDTGERLAIYSNGSGLGWNGNYLTPFSDNYATCGINGAAWSAVWSYAYSSPSDQALKKNITPSTLGTAFLMGLRPVDFNYIDDKKSHLHHGLIAQEVPKTFGGLNTDEDGKWALDYTQLIAPLIVGFQEHERHRAAQDARIAALEARIVALEGART
jgi:Chaperone of endosialidase